MSQRRRSLASDTSRHGWRDTAELRTISEQDGSTIANRPDDEGSTDRKKEERFALVHRESRIAHAIEPLQQELERTENAESLFNISQPPSEAEVEEVTIPISGEKEAPKVYSPLSLPVITSLIPGAILGLLARLGISAIVDYDGHEVFPLAWVQAAGCFVMGFGLGLRDQIGAYYGPLYTALTTGFCGTLTTFSSWQLDIFMSWVNEGHAQRDWFRNVIDGLSKTLFTIAISLSSVTFGLHLARLVARHIPHVRPASLLTRYVFRIVSVLINCRASFSFPGTLTRYVLAATLTPLFHPFPLGTFVANMAGTALLGIFHVLQRTPNLPSPHGCAILQGLIDGFCGNLTTISTFAVEVKALKSEKAWMYVILSWSVSQLLLLVILGSAWWGANIDDSRMCRLS